MPLLKSEKAVAIVRSVSRLPAAVQIEMARRAGIKDQFIYVHDRTSNVDARAAWIQSMNIDRTVIGWFARIDVLCKRKDELPPNVRPSVDFTKALALASAKAKELVEGSTGARSSISETWLPRVEFGAKQSRAGIPKNLAKQREHGRRGGAMTQEGSVVHKWTSPEWQEKREDLAPYWRDPKLTWVKARDRMARKEPDFKGLSYSSMWRIFDARKVKPDEDETR
jgi:hypothetical protein